MVTIDVPGEFSDEDYRSIIEKGLLMHGYALVPSGGNLFKLGCRGIGGQPAIGAERADDSARFAGMPETIVPRALPARADKPNDLLPPPAAAEQKPKKGLFGNMKGWFRGN